MPNIGCPNCQAVVRVHGLAAICPNCGQLVSLTTPGGRSADNPEPEPQVDPAYDLAQVPQPPMQALPVGEDQEVEVYYEEEPKPEPPVHLYLTIGALAAVILVLVATLLILLSRPSIPPVVIAPPPPAVQTPPALPAPAPAPTPRTPGPQAPPAGASQAPTGGSTTAPNTGYVPPPPPPPPPHAELATVRLLTNLETEQQLSDAAIGKAISRGVDYLRSQFATTRLRQMDNLDPSTFEGLNALAVYALLHAGRATNDPELAVTSPFVKGALERLKEWPMDGSKATYSRSLRISALTVFNRPEDQASINVDLQWLLKNTIDGAYTYTVPAPGSTREQNGWDNSNSQYGALGVWAAAEAGHRTPPEYWRAVERHWIDSQSPLGGWGYNSGVKNTTLAMTSAGLTMLFVSRDQRPPEPTPMAQQSGAATNPAAPPAYVGFSRPIMRALEWMDDGDSVMNIPFGHFGYTLYGVERAGLASGLKYFGTHDWYVDLAKLLIRQQAPDGSWTAGDPVIAETSFALLFLSRGRHPVLMTKLRYDGDWNNRGRDLAHFSRIASYQLERPMNWQIADIARPWWEWSDAPTLFITGKQALNLSDEQMTKLRHFAEAGGLLFFHSEDNSQAFTRSVNEFASIAFPKYPLQALPPEHPIFSAATTTTGAQLNGVSNGSRLLMVHAARDLSRNWQPRPQSAMRGGDLGLNISVYAAGRRDFRNRVASIYLPPPAVTPVATIPVARIRYDGNWDPEPAAWERMSRLLLGRTGVAIKVRPLTPLELDYRDNLVAHLTGTEDFSLTRDEASKLREFVNKGGMLIIEPVGGAAAFLDAVEQKLIPIAFPGQQLETLPTTDGLISSTRDGMKDLTEPQVRAQTPLTVAIPRAIRSGEGIVILSSLDISTGLLNATPVGIRGYQPAYAQDLIQNFLLWSMYRIRDIVDQQNTAAASPAAAASRRW